MSRIFVRNIPIKAKESEVEELFKKTGKIIEIVLKQNFAFIQYSHEYEALQAVSKFNDYNLSGNRICVELAKTRTEKLTSFLQFVASHLCIHSNLSCDSLSD